MTPRNASAANPDLDVSGDELARLQVENAALRQTMAELETRVAELEILADRDPLTTVFNRRAFVRELHRVIGYCDRYGATASVVFFDMDGFKGINDQFGHAGGDAALQATAATLAAHIRESDLVGRLGGDEFAVILAQADKAAATVKALSLQALIEAEPAVHAARSIPLKVSFGVRQYETGTGAADLLAGADAAMYLNKSTRG